MDKRFLFSLEIILKKSSSIVHAKITKLFGAKKYIFVLEKYALFRLKKVLCSERNVRFRVKIVVFDDH